MGTATYFSPEQAQGLAGRRPLRRVLARRRALRDGDRRRAVHRRHPGRGRVQARARGRRCRRRSATPTSRPTLEQIILTALAKDPDAPLPVGRRPARRPACGSGAAGRSSAAPVTAIVAEVPAVAGRRRPRPRCSNPPWSRRSTRDRVDEPPGRRARAHHRVDGARARRARRRSSAVLRSCLRQRQGPGERAQRRRAGRHGGNTGARGRRLRGGGRERRRPGSRP